MSITLTKIPNPFQPEINTIEIIDYVNGKSLSHYISDLPLCDKQITFVVSINGIIIQEPYNDVSISDNSFISVCAKVEFTAAAAVGSYFAGAYIAGTAAAYAAFAVGFIGTLAAIGFGMSALVSALTPDAPSFSSVEEGTKPEAVYGWNVLRQSISEGARIPLIFGVNKIAGQVLNQFVTISGNKEIFNILLGICDQQIDSISDVQINDQPHTFFKDIEVITDRLGSNSDTVIPGFDEIVTQIDVGSKLTYNNAVTQETSGSLVEKLIIHIAAPNGIYYSNDSGGLDTKVASFNIRYRLSGGAWSSPDSYSWTENTTKTLRKVIEIDSLPPGQYQVEVTRTNTEEISHRAQSDIYFTSLQEVIKESLIYPGLAKYAVKALATDQLSGGTPRISCIATLDFVSVFDYERTTPIWANKRATNPAWICYALLVWHAHIDKDKLIWDDFNNWADYCDETVDATYRHIINVVITDGNFWEQLQKVARMGHGAIMRRGVRYGVFVDKEETVVSHLFTMGNIIEETFNLQYLPQKDRANAVEIDFMDIDRDFTRQVLTVYSADYLTDETHGQKASINIEAAISKAEAIREGVFHINSNKYLVRVIAFDASIDSFACIVGDLFYFQHESVDYEIGRIGSRILDAGNDDGAGNPYIQLDHEITLDVAISYRVTVRLSDDSFIEKIVNNDPETTDILTLTTSWVDIPEKYDVFLFGAASTYKKIYRLTAITKADDFVRTITGLEYIPEIYSDNSSYVIDVPTWVTRKQKAVHVILNEFLVYENDGSFKSMVNVSWHRAYSQMGANWSVWLEDITAGTEPINMGIAFENSLAITTGFILGNEYKIYVVTLGEGPTDTGDNTETVTILGKQAPPDDILGFSGTWDPIKRQVHFIWAANTNLDLSHYEIRQGGTWTGGTVVATVSDVNFTSIFISEGVSESIVYRIKAIDTSGIESVTEDADTVSIDTADCPLATPTGLDWTSSSTIVSDGSDAVLLLATWVDSSGDSDDWHHYDLQMEDMIVNKISQFATQSNHFQIEVLPNHSYGITIRSVDFSGNHTAWTTQVVHTTTKDSFAPDTPTWPSTGFAIAGFKVIGLNWDNNTEQDLSYYILERSTVGDFSSDVTILGKIDASFKSDNQGLDVSTTYYYRLKAVDTSQNESGYSAIISETTLQVGQTDIAVDAIIASHINVANLAAINANIGTITAGRIQNATNSTFLDLDNDLMSLGNKLTWDGVNLAMVGTLTITSATGYGNISDIPTALSDINSTEGGKLTGIATGADVTGDQILITNPYFEQGLDYWTGQIVTYGTVIANAGIQGGNVVEITGMYYGTSEAAIPVDTSKTYIGKIRVKQTVDFTTGGSNVYAGVYCYDKDNAFIAPRWPVAAAETITVANGWREFLGKIVGEGATQGQFPVGTAYVRTFFWVNHNTGDGTAQVDGFAFYEDVAASNGVSDDADVTANNAQPASWITDIGNLATRDTVNATYIDGGSITTDKLDALSVTAAKIAAFTITAAQITANTITGDEIIGTTISAIRAALGTITSGRIQNGANTTFLDLTNNLMELGSKLVWDGSTLSINGSVVITGGSGIGNLTDAGALAELDDVGVSKLDSTVISGGKITTDLVNANSIVAGTITTDRLIGGAITQTVLTNTTGNISVSSSWVQVQSRTITIASGGYVSITAGSLFKYATSTAKGELQLRRGTTTVVAQSSWEMNFTDDTGASLSYSENLASGSVTYYLYAKSNFACYAAYRWIRMCEFKK